MSIRAAVSVVALLACSAAAGGCARKKILVAAQPRGISAAAVPNVAPGVPGRTDAARRAQQQVDDVIDRLGRSRQQSAPDPDDLPPVATSIGSAPGVATSTGGTIGNRGTAVVTQTPWDTRHDATG